MKGTKMARHGSDGGSVPSPRGKNPHGSMGKNMSPPDKTMGQDKADFAFCGRVHGSVKGGGKNTMPKAICHAQGPQKVK